jgi:L-lactate dehydrogenase complex protein LldF
LLVHLRQRHVDSGHTKRTERLAFKGFQFAFSKPGRLSLAMKVARFGQKPLSKNGRIESKIGPLRGWTEGRDAPTVAQSSFRERWTSLQKELHQFGNADNKRHGEPNGDLNGERNGELNNGSSLKQESRDRKGDGRHE